MSKKALVIVVSSILIFAGIVLAATLNRATFGHFPVDRDQNLWNLWWFKRSLLETGTDPFLTNFLYYPYGAKLYLHTYSPLSMFFSLPFQLTLGIIPAYNIIMLTAFPISAYAMYCLARHVLEGLPQPGRSWGAAFAGILWSFSPYHFLTLELEWLNLVSIQWIPLTILFMLKLEQSRTRRAVLTNGGLTTLFLLLCLWNDYYYSLFLLIFSGLFWLWHSCGKLWRAWQLPSERRPQLVNWLSLTAKLAGFSGLALLLFSPMLVATLQEIYSNNYPKLGNVTEFDSRTIDLLTFFLPAAQHPWWGKNWGLWQALGVVTLDSWGVVLSYVGLGLALIALFKWQGAWGFWLFSGVVWLVLAGGAYLRLNNANTGIPLPGHWLNSFPIFQLARFPHRYILMFNLSLALLAGIGLTYLLNRLQDYRFFKRWSAVTVVGILVVGVAFFEGWFGLPSKNEPIEPPAFIVSVAASPQVSQVSNVPVDRAILELPVTQHGSADHSRMLYQLYHQRPIIGGYISRDPLDPYLTKADFPLYEILSTEYPSETDIVPTKTSQQQLGLLNYAKIGFVVLYPQDFRTSVERLKRTQQFLEQVFSSNQNNSNSTLYFKDNLVTVYRVPSVELQEPVVVLANGWSALETANQGKIQIKQRWIKETPNSAQVVVVVGPNVVLKESYSLKFTVYSPDKPRRLEIFLDSQKLGENLVTTKATQLAFDNVKLKYGINVFTFKPNLADGVYNAKFVDGKVDTNRTLRLAFSNISLAS